MSRMFKLWKNGRIATVNPINGCGFGCYGGNCWAAQMAKRLQGAGVRGYENGFEPSFVPERMEVPNADVVWIGSMGDLAFQPTKNIYKIIEEMIEPNPDTLFFLETKMPSRYGDFIHKLPENVIISTTIESDLTYDNESKAPSCHQRYMIFRDLDWPKKHVSIEPVMDFQLKELCRWIEEINPEIVSAGYDNYNCGLTEPEPEKFYSLVDYLEDFTNVEVKTDPKELDRFDCRGEEY